MDECRIVVTGGDRRLLFLLGQERRWTAAPGLPSPLLLLVLLTVLAGGGIQRTVVPVAASSTAAATAAAVGSTGVVRERSQRILRRTVQDQGRIPEIGQTPECDEGFVESQETPVREPASQIQETWSSRGRTVVRCEITDEGNIRAGSPDTLEFGGMILARPEMAQTTVLIQVVLVEEIDQERNPFLCEFRRLIEVEWSSGRAQRDIVWTEVEIRVVTEATEDRPGEVRPTGHHPWDTLDEEEIECHEPCQSHLRLPRDWIQDEIRCGVLRSRGRPSTVVPGPSSPGGSRDCCTGPPGPARSARAGGLLDRGHTVTES